jgi:malonyl-CoA/methylmalonyl-CoA synthetase
MSNLYRVFRDHFDLSHPLFIDAEGETIATYRDLEQRSAQFAMALTQLGLKPGDRVAVQTEKSIAALYLYCGCLRAGLIYLPLNTAYGAHELNHFLQDATPSLLMVDPARADDHAARSILTLTMDRLGEGSLTKLAEECPTSHSIEPRAPDDIAVIVYTSGTTGLPKGAMISHDNLISNAQTLTSAWDWTQTDVMLHTLPIFHVHGLFVGLHLPLLSGCAIIFQPSFDAAAVRTALAHATVFMGVPTYYTRLLSQGIHQKDCEGMRLFISGSAPLLAQTFQEWEDATGTVILERYGMSETGMNTANPLDGARKPGTVGPPLPGVECLVVNDASEALPAGETGNLWVRGPNVFQGYWQNVEKTAESFTSDGYFKTGDLAVVDDDGYISIVGRSKDLIITGGLNVYPKEIELVLDAIDGVMESAVIGLPHPDFGESVCAVIVSLPEVDLTAELIYDQIKPLLANFKTPKKIFFIQNLPRNTMGKVQKNQLREQFSDAAHNP